MTKKEVILNVAISVIGKASLDNWINTPIEKLGGTPKQLLEGSNKDLIKLSSYLSELWYMTRSKL